MKSILIGLVTLASISAFSQNVSKSTYCQVRGQTQINAQKELVDRAIATGSITKLTEEFFLAQISELQKNYDYLCKGIRISEGPRLSARENQLDLIMKAVDSGDVSKETLAFFMDQLKNF